MICGITQGNVPGFVVKENDKPEDAAEIIPQLLGGLVNKLNG